MIRPLTRTVSRNSITQRDVTLMCPVDYKPVKNMATFRYVAPIAVSLASVM